ncbi:hypothetical protein ACEN8K_45815, partial [Variovorax sp. CT11-76]
ARPAPPKKVQSKRESVSRTAARCGQAGGIAIEKAIDDPSQNDQGMRRRRSAPCPDSFQKEIESC